MMKFLRWMFDIIFWWMVIIVSVAFIGYIAWPLLSDKFYSLCSNNSEWRLCRGDWGRISSADEVQKTIEKKTESFFSLGKTAVSDVVTDEGGKWPVTYMQNKETGVYMPQR